jgi:hypothetical protein
MFMVHWAAVYAMLLEWDGPLMPAPVLRAIAAVFDNWLHSFYVACGRSIWGCLMKRLVEFLRLSAEPGMLRSMRWGRP